MPVTLSPYALISDAEYTAIMTTSLSTDQIKALINRATAAIERKCRRKFVHDDGDRQIFDLVRAGSNRDILSQNRIYLRFRPIVEVVSITDPAGNTLDPDDLAIFEGEGIIEGFLQTAFTTNGRPSRWTITYVPGYFSATTDVDEDLKEACIKTVAAWIASPTGRVVASKSVGGDSISYVNQSSAPGDAAPSYQLPTSALSLLQDGGWISHSIV